MSNRPPSTEAASLRAVTSGHERRTEQPNSHRPCDIAAASLLLASVALLFAWRVHHGFRFSTFSDETGHLIGAKSIAAGYVLYRDFVDEHGPLAYALPQLFGALAGWRDPLLARCIPIAALLSAATAIAASPGLRGAWERLVAAALFIGLIASVWLIQALFMMTYQPLAGMLMLIGVAQFTWPAWQGARIGRASLFVAGSCFGLTPFIAFTYGPACVLFAASGVLALRQCDRPAGLAPMAAGAAVSIAPMLAWMAAFADFRGYIAYHFIASIAYYAPYLPSRFSDTFTNLWPRRQPVAVVQALAVLATSAAFVAMSVTRLRGARQPGRRSLPLLLGLLGVILTNPRGSPIFQNGAFVVVAFGLAALTWAASARAFLQRWPRHIRTVWILAACFYVMAAEAVARRATSTPHGYTRAALSAAQSGDLAQSDEPWARKLRQATDPGEPVLALPFYPDFYLLAGRLPMKGYFIYLPWDADFASKPVLGLQHDLCHDLPDHLPPVIYYNGWIVWNRYDPSRYMACVIQTLAAHYQTMPGEKDLFVRKDRISRLTQ